jgi:hypothetical protein
MSINLRRLQSAMLQKLLYNADIRSARDQMCRIAMPQGVHRGMCRNTGLFRIGREDVL